jgi:hypothetical protein
MTDTARYEPNPLLRQFVSLPGGAGYDVDLTEFACGGRIENIPARARKSWQGDFSGRPIFANELARLYDEDRPHPESSDTIRWAMRGFFRFLDYLAENHATEIRGIRDVTDSLGPLLIEWSDTQFLYRKCKSVLDRLRELNKLPPLFWPARKPDAFSTKEPTDATALMQFYRAMKREARGVKAMFAEGSALASQGYDPRGAAPSSSDWQSRENRAWIVRELTSERLLDRAEFRAEGAFWGMMGGPPGPEYLAPGMTDRGREGIVGALRWFHPSYRDTAVFLWLFLVGTGWNLSTALNLDVTDDASWFEPHPHSDDHVQIVSYKGRAHDEHHAISMRKPEWHSFQIVKFMIERTKPLRATARHQLENARRVHAVNPTSRNAAEVVELERVVRSPWLYHVVNKTGALSALGKDDANHLGPIARAVVKKSGLLERYPMLETVCTSDTRDAWINFAYVQSGFNVLITQLAAQHKSPKTTRYYLKSRRYREHSEKQVRKVQNILFSEISHGRVVDPTRLRLLVVNGEITPEQENRLKDLRQRTRLGMGCLEPTSPPREIAPDHRPGSLCRVQRCTGCELGVVFADSLRPLARACAELIHLKRTIPLASWEGSSFQWELASIERTLTSFPSGLVAKELQNWSARIQSGEVKVHDTHPSY